MPRSQRNEREHVFSDNSPYSTFRQTVTNGVITGGTATVSFLGGSELHYTLVPAFPSKRGICTMCTKIFYEEVLKPIDDEVLCLACMLEYVEVTAMPPKRSI